jgi:hypothetical protein
MCRRRRSSGEIWGSLVRLRVTELCVLGEVLVSLSVYLEEDMCKAVFVQELEI